MDVSIGGYDIIQLQGGFMNNKWVQCQLGECSDKLVHCQMVMGTAPNMYADKWVCYHTISTGTGR